MATFNSLHLFDTLEYKDFRIYFKTWFFHFKVSNEKL